MTVHVWGKGAEQRSAPRLTIPDALTLARLVSVPMLWIVALVWGPFWLGIGLAAAAFTDVLDGQIARRSHRTTARGSQLDSIADHVLTASTVLWLVWLRPDFIAERLPWLATWATLGVSALVVSWVRFRRIGDLHLYSAKIAGLMGYLFAIWLLVFGTYATTLFYVLMATLFVGTGESLLLVATRQTVDAHVGSIFKAVSSSARSEGSAIRGATRRSG
ncbi:MAG TPA: CDP-alcohol phosphatidyltransferase family protein [Gemmatimonadaceae bacterium]|nr:CDP-alcohol phosphatidyltransferase family protein [Gemmatimonadaceae bacterium]